MTLYVRNHRTSPRQSAKLLDPGDGDNDGVLRNINFSTLFSGSSSDAVSSDGGHLYRRFRLLVSPGIIILVVVGKLDVSSIMGFSLHDVWIAQELR